jgi:predicted negative regulator of RcsB-dependent stress response
VVTLPPTCTAFNGQPWASKRADSLSADSKMYQKIQKCIKNERMHVAKMQERHFIRTKTNCGRSTTLQRACQIEN